MNLPLKSLTTVMLPLIVSLAVAARAEEDADRLEMIWPNRLKPGDTIMFVSPAGPIERKLVEKAKAEFEARGYRVKYRDDVSAVEGYLAGSDERRAEELMQAFLDPEVKGVVCTRGGYGTMRILDMLDYDAIRAHPKVFAGFSDITALHAALNRRAGLVTFHSPGATHEEEESKTADPYATQTTAEGNPPPPSAAASYPGQLPRFSKQYFFRAIEAVDAATVADRSYEIELPAEPARRPARQRQGPRPPHRRQPLAHLGD